MKQVKDFIIIENISINNSYSKLILSPADGAILPVILPGQFVQVAVEAPDVFLRRPISINDVDRESNTLTLLVRNAGRSRPYRHESRRKT